MGIEENVLYQLETAKTITKEFVDGIINNLDRGNSRTVEDIRKMYPVGTQNVYVMIETKDTDNFLGYTLEISMVNTRDFSEFDEKYDLVSKHGEGNTPNSPPRFRLKEAE